MKYLIGILLLLFSLNLKAQKRDTICVPRVYINEEEVRVNGHIFKVGRTYYINGKKFRLLKFKPTNDSLFKPRSCKEVDSLKK